MVQLQSAKVMNSVSNESLVKFKKETLESESFNKLVTGIEKSAEAGKNAFSYFLDKNEEPRILGVFAETLKLAGYEVKDTSNTSGKGIVVKW
ncbi:hypothetical protein [Viridibacillus arvi]|uniref:hypothetical protein n=1 Tax=Viridibacillus arvi TaxID=263475 RepID=UPI003D067B23